MNDRIHIEHLRLRGGPPAARRRNDRAAPVLAATLYLPADATPERTPSPPALPGLVVGHGAGSRRARHDRFCRTACAAGLAVLAIDFRGHGESTGSADGPLHEDILAAAHLLRSHPLVDGTRIGYRGSSMGGYYGVQAAADAELRALVLICPAGECVLLAGVDRHAAEQTARNESGDVDAGMGDESGIRLDAPAMRTFLLTHPMLSAAEDIFCPTLLLHARGDTVVPLRDTLDLAARLSGPAEVIIDPGGDHRSLQASQYVHGRVAAWLARTLASAR